MMNALTRVIQGVYAHRVLALCGANAGFITGQNLLIDGGGYPGTY